MAPPKLAKGMDPLGVISDEEELSDSGEEGGGAGGDAAPPPQDKPKAREVDFETLQRAGYRSGPSVLFIPEQRPAGEHNWSWGRGERGGGDAGPESAAEREHTRYASGAGVDEAVALQLKAAEHAKALREAARAEAAELRDAARGGRGGGRGGAGAGKEDKDKLSFNAREKRKRERGQAVGGRNFVEEEKRIQRQFGVFSGFDT